MMLFRVKSVGNVSRYAVMCLTALALTSCGGGGGSAGTTTTGGTGSTSPGGTTVTVGSASLIFSSPELKSAGAAGTEVTVTALIKNTDNVALSDIPVTFTADSGALSNVSATSDKSGKATATLSTSGDHTDRRITVAVQAGSKASGTVSASGTVDVVGTYITVVGPSAIATGNTGDFTISVKDSADAPVANVPVTLASQKGNALAVKTSNGGTATAPLTNFQGLVVVTMTASQSGSDTLSASAQGVKTTSSISVNPSKLLLAVTDSLGNTITVANTSTSCQQVTAHYEVGGVAQSGSVNIATSRGQIFSDNACTSALSSSSVTLTSGDSAPVYLKSDTAGIATVTATASGGLSSQTNVEFIAALTASATISLQAEPAVIGANSGSSSQLEQSILTAVVRDGTSFNNFVKNAVIEFTILQDKSGGSLSNPAVVTTASNGTASVSFVSGAADTPQDGVTIQAKIQGTATSVTKTLTVARKALFISAGTGNSIGAPSATTYQKDYAVFVTDASGNPVSGVAVTAAAIPTRYKKGTLGFDATLRAWIPSGTVYTCTNEDVNKNGILDTGEDFNGNGVLDPGIPLNVTSTGTTDNTGSVTISITYPRDRAQWLEVQIVVHASVSGTESTYTIPAYWLSALASDVASASTTPPGFTSPFGVNACNLAN